MSISKERIKMRNLCRNAIFTWLSMLSIMACASTTMIERPSQHNRDDTPLGTSTVNTVVPDERDTSDTDGMWLQMLGVTHDHVAMARLINNEVVVWGAHTTQSFDDVIQIVHGTSHTTLLHRNGTVSTYGDATLGQTNVPVINERIRKIVAGDTFSVGLTESGHVVGWGQAVVNRDGAQLAITPYPLNVSNAVDIAAYGHMTLVHHQDGAVSVWGDDETRLTAHIAWDTIRQPTRMVMNASGMMFLDNQGHVAWFSLYPKNAENRTKPLEMPTDIAQIVPISQEAMMLVTENNDVYIFKDTMGVAGPVDLKIHARAPIADMDDYIFAVNEHSELEVLRFSGESLLTRWKSPIPQQMPNAVEMSVKIIGTDFEKTTQVIYRYKDTSVHVFADGEEILNYPYSVSSVAWIGDENGIFSVISPSGTAVVWGAADNSRQFVPEWAHPLRYLDLPTEYVFSEICTVGILADGSFVEWDYSGNTPCRYQRDLEPSKQGREMFPKPPVDAQKLVKVIRPKDKTQLVIGLREDGRIVAWGQNGENRPATVPVNAENDVVDIANGYTSILALRNDGQIVMWDLDKGESLAPANAMPSQMIRVFYGFVDTYYVSLRTDGTLVVWTGKETFEYPGMYDVVDIEMYSGRGPDSEIPSFVVLHRDGMLSHVGVVWAIPPTLQIRTYQE